MIRGLRRQAWVWAVTGLLVTTLVFFLLQRGSSGVSAHRWLPLPMFGNLLLVGYLVARLEDNRRTRDGRLLHSLGLGNGLTVFRGMELALLSGFLLIPQPSGWFAWLPMVLFTSAVILDFLDGYTARARDESTHLGEELEGLLDGAGMMIATLLAIRYGTLTWWFIPFGAARFLFLIGDRIRKQSGKPVHPLPASRSRRPIAGITMGFLSAALWPIVKPPGSILAGWLFLIPFCASFARDWMVVSGAMSPESPTYSNLRQQMNKVLIQHAPVGIRIALSGLLTWAGLLHLESYTDQIRFYAAAGFPKASLLAPAFLILQWAAVPLLLIGFAGRFVAFILVFPIGLTILGLGLDTLRAGLLVLDLMILMLGTGKGSLWKPSDQLFGRRAGGLKKDSR